jgi:ankyrin repeat protein
MQCAAATRGDSIVKLFIQFQGIANEFGRMFLGIGNAPSSRAPLASACARGDAVQVKMILAADRAAAVAADANAWTPLMFAASNGHVDVISMLLQCDLDVDAVNSFRWTALYAACANGHIAAAQVNCPNPCLCKCSS